VPVLAQPSAIEDPGRCERRGALLGGGADESERLTQLNLVADLSVRAKPSIKGHGADEEQKVGW